MKNLGFYYNKLYFNDLNSLNSDDSSILEKEKFYEQIFKKIEVKATNKELLDSKFSSSDFEEMEEVKQIDNLYNFSLKTTYPGLIIGSGYSHEMKIDNFFKLGLSFDYTTGLPIIPGSSIKGLLRSSFPGLYKEEFKKMKLNENEKIIMEEAYKNREIYIIQLLEGIIDKKRIDAESSKDFVYKLESELFEGIIMDENREIYSTLPLFRDVYFDAEIAYENNERISILSDDYITPHNQGEFKNPVPIKFLKVSPNVVFEFKFKLPIKYKAIRYNNKQIETKEFTPLLTYQEKLELFRNILLDLGIGAKTNVGYGQFESLSKEEHLTYCRKRNERIEKKKYEVLKRNQEVEEAKILDGKSESYKKIYKKVLVIKDETEKIRAAKKLLSEKKSENIESAEIEKLAELIKEDLVKRKNFIFNAKNECKNKDVKYTKIVCDILKIDLPI